MGSGKYESFKYHHATERTGKGPVTLLPFSPTPFSVVFEQVQPGPKTHFVAFFSLLGLRGAHFAPHAKSRLIYGWDGFFSSGTLFLLLSRPLRTEDKPAAHMSTLFDPVFAFFARATNRLIRSLFLPPLLRSTRLSPEVWN